MTKAEEAGLNFYPPMVTHSYSGGKVDWNKTRREIYVEGYEQAEKDLALTWQDIKTIVEIADGLVEKDVNGQLPDVCETEEGYYKAILDAFNKTRK